MLRATGTCTSPYSGAVRTSIRSIDFPFLHSSDKPFGVTVGMFMARSFRVQNGNGRTAGGQDSRSAIRYIHQSFAIPGVVMADHSLRVYDSILDMLSGAENPTPLLRLNRVIPFKHTQVYAKLEWYNPFGAVKDRVAANLVRDAQERGVPIQNLVEPTSGNTGMALAMIANTKGYPFTATLSLAIPEEKRAALRVFGAKLIELADDLCPMPGAPEGAMARATELAKQPGWHQLNQYNNPAQ